MLKSSDLSEIFRLIKSRNQKNGKLVFSTEDYTAYETSTPELDDVIRIADDTKRSSGLILSEHNE